MTWKQLAEKILTELDEDQQGTDVTVFSHDDEFYAVENCLMINEETDILDKDHPFLQMK